MKKENEYKETMTVRTDLAVEARDMYVEREEEAKRLRGVKETYREEDGIKITSIEIDADGERTLNKKRGSYVTIFSNAVVREDTTSQQKTATVLAKEIKQLLTKHKVTDDAKGLVVGLGNWNVTPDALGPMTVGNILVTNHLFELKYETVASGYRPVSAISPGVMGVTGMETSDIVKSIIKQFQPQFLIVVDALASRSIERINTTIQITDTGIHPGSGVGNQRKELSKDILGIPVIAIGVPTVVDAVTIVSDTLHHLLKHLGRQMQEEETPRSALLTGPLSITHENLTDDDVPDATNRSTLLGLIGNLDETEQRQLLEEVLTPSGKNLIVTPKEVDTFLEDMAHVVAQGINSSLHENVAYEKAANYTR